ncbi:hypothetical protein [Mesorhizobium sp. WSM4904]|uniref:AbiU2 domain-containing protein n=1 Tax=Mesorhizobium sp. WSM4904 TaxID=3038545 RepID=UPI0024183C55|nr:hypothetical protein [Mesorhizobium sp. WSM4904]WFP61369.1 hypothetical protein QAZ47_23175 [Mesorhizobium sp. WSM4904]
MTTKTADQSRADCEIAMGQELGAIYAELIQELSNIYLVWGQYKILFGTRESRVDLLNSAAGGFFGLIQDNIWHQVLLSISRLTDRPTIAGHATLTVRRLADLIADQTTAEAVRAEVDLAMKAQEFCRDWRNNLIGHNNLDMRVNPAARSLAPASERQVDDALAALAGVLNTLASHYLLPKTLFEDVSDASALLYVLHDGVAARKERQARREAGIFENDYPRDL